MATVVETPLNWIDLPDGGASATTPFGSYAVERAEPEFGIAFPRWSYRFHEYYCEERFECESIEEGKALAQAHWNERVSGIFRIREEDQPEVYGTVEQVLVNLEGMGGGVHLLVKVPDEYEWKKGEIAICYVIEDEGEVNERKHS